MIGIALGVAALITVLSVMNGFDHEIRHRLFGMARQVTVTTVDNVLPSWQRLREELVNYPGVKAVAPFVDGQGMLAYGGLVHPALISGILPAPERTISEINNKMVQGSLDALKPGGFGIILGETLAASLGLSVGDKVTVITPNITISLAGIIPRLKPFKVVGIFKIGTGFGFDAGMAFIHLNDAQKLFQYGSAVSALRLQLNDLYAAPRISTELMKQLPGNYQVSNWTQEYGELFEAIKLEKSMVFLLLLLILAVAIFNMVSSLVMVVTDKKSDIAILRTFGATPRTILQIFIVQGGIIGLVGTFAGLVLGIILALNATEIVSIVESYFHVQLLSSDIYYVNYLPSKLEWLDVVRICSIALLMSLAATIYPAWRAARVQPAEALRYE